MDTTEKPVQDMSPMSVTPRCPECASVWAHVDSIPVDGWEEFSGWYCHACGFFTLD